MMRKRTWVGLEREEVDQRRKEETRRGVINIEEKIGIQRHKEVVQSNEDEDTQGKEERAVAAVCTGHHR
jgi:ABC-type antimicrobial peptide transport system ATPase subunit